MRHELQRLVTHRVAEGVVDLFELVDVDEQHPKLGAVALGDGDGTVQAVKQEHPVGQLREGVQFGNPLRMVQGLRCGLRVELVAHGRDHQLLIGLQQLGRLAGLQALFRNNNILQ